MHEFNVINYGQHFLIDDEVIDRFINLAEIKDKSVIEIGPGNGVITKRLCEVSKHVTCYEIDTSLKHDLDKLKEKYDNLDIIYENFLDCEIGECDTIISGLPYQILEPFLKKIINIEFRQVLIIIGNSYALSNYLECFINNEIKYTNLLTKCFFFVNVYDEIKPSSFYPEPKTLSSIVELKKRDKVTLIEAQELYFFREIIEQKDKKIKNALINGLINFYRYRDKSITQNKAREIITRLNIDNNILESKIDNLNNKDITKLYVILKNNSVHL